MRGTLSPFLVFFIASWATWFVAPGLVAGGLGVLRQRRPRSINYRQWHWIPPEPATIAPACAMNTSIPSMTRLKTVTPRILTESFTANITARVLIAVLVADGRTSSTGQRVFWPERRQVTVLRVKTRNGPLGGLRVELEYFFRQSNYDQTADISFGVGPQGDKLRDEISASD